MKSTYVVVLLAALAAVALGIFLTKKKAPAVNPLPPQQPGSQPAPQPQSVSLTQPAPQPVQEKTYSYNDIFSKNSEWKKYWPGQDGQGRYSCEDIENAWKAPWSITQETKAFQKGGVCFK